MSENNSHNVNNNCEDEVVTAIINLVKRIQSLESRMASIEAFLSGKFKLQQPKPNGDAKWDEWARKLILKVVEWLMVIVAAIVGVKLSGM